jgi:SNF2 family DNA or RNA helicase
MALRDYQQKAITFLYEHDKALVLASVGAGKTAIALTAMEEMLNDGIVNRWLVLAPKRVCKDVWPQERDKWAPSLGLAVALGPPKQRKAAFESDAKVVVTNYDNIQTLPPGDFDGIVFDELTKLKNASGLRFKALYKYIKNIPVRWGLTGSFTSNGLEDVFGQCKIVDEGLLGPHKTRFLNQYFYCVNRDFNQWEPMKGSLEQVMHRIKPATFLLDNAEYKRPPMTIVPLKCDMPDRKPYEDMKNTFVAEFNDEKAVAVNAAVVVGKLQQMASGFVYAPHPVWFSSHKFDLLNDVLEENQRANTIIVYNYKEELAELLRRYPKAATLDDKDAIGRWNRGEIELLLLHPKSAQFGLNLQEGGSKMIFVSLPWSLTDFEQAIGRIHRQGQKYPVDVYVLLTNKSVDERIFNSLEDGKKIAAIALEELK